MGHRKFHNNKALLFNTLFILFGTIMLVVGLLANSTSSIGFIVSGIVLVIIRMPKMLSLIKEHIALKKEVTNQDEVEIKEPNSFIELLFTIFVVIMLIGFKSLNSNAPTPVPELVKTVYTSPSGLFSITFPAHPTIESEDIIDEENNKIIKTSYFTESGKTAYFISTYQYPQDILIDQIPNFEKVLEAFPNEMVSNLPNSRLSRIENTTVHSRKAVSYTIENNEVSSVGLVTSKGNILYNTFVVYPANQLTADASNYLDSFTL